MSYARLVMPLKAHVANVGVCTIPKGSGISHVRLVDGKYTFKACIHGTSGAWVVATTMQDLPAHTDKGIEQRKTIGVGLGALSRGRPKLGAIRAHEPQKFVSVKLRADQHDWIETVAKTTISEFVREALVSAGMPS